jgi:hypothetical protein
MSVGVDLADNSQELSFFNDGDALAQVTSTFEPYSAERAGRRRTWVALALTGLILLIAVIVCVVALPASQA